MTDTRTGPTIGVFDSGFGGLTVLRALLPLIPGAHYIYLGDTARLPYGSKSQETIARYAVESARFLANRGADLLVIACNTASALALEDIRRAVPIPVLGVIQPGAQAALATTNPTQAPASLACHPERSEGPASFQTTEEMSSRPEHEARSEETPASPNLTTNPSSQPEAAPFTAAAEGPATLPSPAHRSHLSASDPEVLVLATTATVASHAYREACAGLGLRATEKACPLLVPLVEEGWVDHTVTRDVLHIYLLEALATCKPSAVLLGCTHYPLIASLIRETLHRLGCNAPVIDSAAATAQSVATQLALNPTNPQPNTPTPATAEFFATDSVEKFQTLGSAFLGQPLHQVHHLDLGG